MNKRDLLLNLVSGQAPPDHIPAAFFLHFDPAYHAGQAAVDRHLEFFRFTGMDFVKIQYEQRPPAGLSIQKPEDWARLPVYPQEFFEGPVQIARGLVEAAGDEALVVMTLYSPLMWAVRVAGEAALAAHLEEDPAAVATGLEIMAENVLRLARGCIQAGVDGFYASSQGGEAGRFPPGAFQETIRPADLAVWEGIKHLPFNILHVCDYQAGYDDLSPFLDYPGQVVNASLHLGEETLTPSEVSEMFGRPFMGGLERTGIIATGSEGEIRREVERVLSAAPERFILAADCTVPGDTPWENLRTAIEAAHSYRG
jgi:uroporphyrinogen decarboxylase